MAGLGIGVEIIGEELTGGGRPGEDDEIFGHCGGDFALGRDLDLIAGGEVEGGGRDHGFGPVERGGFEFGGEPGVPSVEGLDGGLADAAELNEIGTEPLSHIVFEVGVEGDGPDHPQAGTEFNRLGFGKMTGHLVIALDKRVFIGGFGAEEESRVNIGVPFAGGEQGEPGLVGGKDWKREVLT